MRKHRLVVQNAAEGLGIDCTQLGFGQSQNCPVVVIMMLFPCKSPKTKSAQILLLIGRFEISGKAYNCLYQLTGLRTPTVDFENFFAFSASCVSRCLVCTV